MVERPRTVWGDDARQESPNDIDARAKCCRTAMSSSMAAPTLWQDAVRTRMRRLKRPAFNYIDVGTAAAVGAFERGYCMMSAATRPW